MADYKKYPRVLIVSRNALKLSGSNGKVMAEMFGNWDKECLAQLYTYTELPEYDGCYRYFRVTDKEAIKALLPWKRVGCEVSNAQPSVKEGVSKTGNVVRKNPLTLLLQDMVWNTGCWKSKELKRWIDDFKPEVLFFMAGSSSFMAKIAIDIVKRRQIPLVVFNTENYYLKNYNYLERYGWKWVFPLLKWENDRMFERLMQTSCKEIYNNTLLDELYAERFGRHGEVLYQGSSLKPFQRRKYDNSNLKFTYAGNLGINRHQALIQIGQALQSISSSYYLDVYGRATDDVSHQLTQAKGIRYQGFISYDELVARMQESDFMVHAESFDEFWVKDLQTGFSTKLSDILATGSCLILFADKNLACSRYVEENKCGCLISSPHTLVEQLKELINNEALQEEYRRNALITAKRDLDGDNNRNRFFAVIANIANTHDKHKSTSMNRHWLYSSRHLIVNDSPHSEPDVDYILSGKAWSDYPNAVCAKWVSEFDKLKVENYWYVIKDTPFDVALLKAKRRYEITKGVRNFNVTVVDNVDAIKDQLYEVYTESLKGYSGEGVKAMSEDAFYGFCNMLNSSSLMGGRHLAFIVRQKETDKICGFAHVPLYQDWAAFSTMKTIPTYERLGVNAALVMGILEYLAPHLSKDGFYFSDGSRTLFHQTAFQDYLEKYFQFRKAYCKLNVVYNPRYRPVVKALFPFRRMLRCLSFNRTLKGLIAVLEMENIVRTQKIQLTNEKV